MAIDTIQFFQGRRMYIWPVEDVFEDFTEEYEFCYVIGDNPTCPEEFIDRSYKGKGAVWSNVGYTVFADIAEAEHWVLMYQDGPLKSYKELLDNAVEDWR